MKPISARLPAAVPPPSFGPALGPLLDQLNSRFAGKRVTFTLQPDGSVRVRLPRADPKLRKEVREALPPGVKARIVVAGKSKPAAGGGGSDFGPALGPLADQIAKNFGVTASVTGPSSVTVFLPNRSVSFEDMVRGAFPPGVKVTFEVKS